MKHRFFIMRHGETEANATGRIQGSTDLSSSLTERGRSQAASAGSLVFDSNDGDSSRVVVDQVYISPLTRAKETLECMRLSSSPGSIPANETVHPDLTGIPLYSWEGRNVTELSERNVMLFRAWTQGDANAFVIDGKRPISEVWQRAKRLWKDLLRSCGNDVFDDTRQANEDSSDSRNDKDETCTLLVCHGTLSQALLCTSFGWDEKYFRVYDFPNAGMVEVLWERGASKATCWRWRHPKLGEWHYPNKFDPDLCWSEETSALKY
jgi:probable phosphoglycerate mutase